MLTIAMPMVASEKGSPMMLPMLNFFPLPPKRPVLLASILLSVGVSLNSFMSRE